MAKNIVAVKEAGQLIAAEYLDRACKNAGYLGVASVQDGKLSIAHQGNKPTVDIVQKVQEHFKDSVVMFCFGENVKTQLEEDRLPFLCQLDKAKGDEVAVFLTGSFEGYQVKDSSHIDEFHCFDDFLSKKLPKIYKGAGSDFEEFLKELNDPITQQDLSNSWTNRGFMSFLTSSGKAVTLFNKGNIFVRKYSWGTVSDGLSFEEKASTPPKEEKKLSILEKMLAKKEAATASVPAVSPPKTDTKAVIAAAVSGKEFEEVKLPAEAKDWNNKQKSRWWIGEVGYQPNGYKDLKCTVKRYPGTKQGVLAKLADSNGRLPPNVNEDSATPITQEVVEQETKEVHPNKVDPKTLPDKTQKEAPENAKDTAPKHVSMDNMPILSPKQKLKLKKDWMQDSEVIKVLGDDFQQMLMHPKNLKELEDNYQSFWDGLGEERRTLSFEALMKLGTIDLKSLAVLAFNEQNDRVKAEIKLRSIEKANPNLKLAM